MSKNFRFNIKKILFVFLTLLSVSQLQCNDINWSFPPTILSSMSQNASDPHLSMDANGNVVAVWVENGVVKSSTHPIGMGWSSAVNISANGASSPRVVSDPSGNATAIWIENGVAKAATKPFNSSWSASTSLSSTGASAPDLAVDSSGDVVAVWARGNNVESSTKLFGANWQNRVTLTSTAASIPKVAIGGSGANQRVVAVWQGTSGATNVVYSSTKLIPDLGLLSRSFRIRPITLLIRKLLSM